MRVFNISSMVTAVINHSGQSSDGLLCALASIQPVANTRPTTMGAIPSLNARTERSSRLRCTQRVAR